MFFLIDGLFLLNNAQTFDVKKGIASYMAKRFQSRS